MSWGAMLEWAGMYWTILGCSRMYWDELGSMLEWAGMYWGVLGYIGVYWDVLG